MRARTAVLLPLPGLSVRLGGMCIMNLGYRGFNRSLVALGSVVAPTTRRGHRSQGPLLVLA